MKQNERILIGNLVLFFLAIWLGFAFHADSNFAGSAIGGFFGVTGSILMLFPLFYLFIKRSDTIKKAVTKHISMSNLLLWHVYAGIIGPILVMIHTGHKFNSILGTSLTTLMIIVVVSGFIGRYLLSQFSQGLKEKQHTLTELTAAYHFAQHQLQTCCIDEREKLKSYTGFFSRILPSFLSSKQLTENTSDTMPTIERALMLSDAIADMEYSISIHDKVKKMFIRWLKLHITISLILYALLAGHIFSGIYFGLRWFN